MMISKSELAAPVTLSGLYEDGFCVIPDVLDATMLARLREHFDGSVLVRAPKDNFGNAGAFIIADYHDQAMIELLTWPKTMSMFQTGRFSDLRLHNFYVSTKPPGTAALAWHSDLFYEYEGTEPTELFLIYYLQDTTPENGCLRVVPGSHKWSHQKRHAQPAAASRDDETDVPVLAGSLFVGDRRILHATHANKSDAWRTCLTIAYATQFDMLDEAIKTLIVQNQCLPTQEHIRHPELHDIDPRLAAILPVL